MPEHKDITDPNIHEVKGASTASAGQILTANGDGTTSFIAPIVYSNVEVGSYRVVNGSSSPVALTSADTYYQLENDAAGVGTSSTYGLDGITDVWDEVNDYFILSELDLGDVATFHIDVDVTTTSSNTAVDIDLEFAIGGVVYTIPMLTKANIKSASTVRFTEQRSIYIRDTQTRDLPARVKARADTVGASVLLREVGLFVVKRG